MTNKPMLSVERELLKSALNAVEYLALRGDDIGLSNEPVAKELRALLDKPAEPSRFVGAAQYWSENEQALRDVCKFEGLKGLVYQVVRDRDRPAAQHQGEPVAICRLWNEGGSGERTSVEFIGEPCADGTLLYAEQPAPVAVVMPERKKDGKWVDDGSGNGSSEWHEDPDANGYNEALDDVARLNGVKP